MGNLLPMLDLRVMDFGTIEGNGQGIQHLLRRILVIALIGDRDFTVNIVSKSGGTLEPALAFRVFKGLLEKKYGKDAKKRIVATTDASRGVLHDLAVAEGWERFVVPDDVGGLPARRIRDGAVRVATVLAAGEEWLALLPGILAVVVLFVAWAISPKGKRV